HALADIVGTGVAEHRIQRLILAQAPGAATDDDRELTLEVDLLSLAWIDDRFVGTDRRRGRLHEQKRHGRTLQVHFLDMGDVVEARAENPRGLDRAQETDAVEPVDVARQGRGCERRARASLERIFLQLTVMDLAVDLVSCNQHPCLRSSWSDPINPSL